MKSFKAIKSNSGVWAIGETDYNGNSITGLGAIYSPKNQAWVIGRFNKNKNDGWYITNIIDKKTHQLSFIITNSNPSFLSNNVKIYITPNFTKIHLRKNNEEPHSSVFLSQYSNWMFCSNNKYVSYFYRDKCFRTCENNWQRAFGIGEIKYEYWTPIGNFKHIKFGSNFKFNNRTNVISPIGDGPKIEYDPDISTTTIGFVVDGKYNGIVYKDSTEFVTIANYKNGVMDGLCFKIQKKMATVEIHGYNNGVEQVNVGVAYPGLNSFEVKNNIYGNKKEFNSVQVDDDLTTTIFDHLNLETVKFERTKTWKYKAPDSKSTEEYKKYLETLKKHVKPNVKEKNIKIIRKVKPGKPSRHKNR